MTPPRLLLGFVGLAAVLFTYLLVVMRGMRAGLTVSVVGHVAGQDYAAMIATVEAGDLAAAREIHRRLIPVTDELMTVSQGAIMVKAALVQLGVIESAFVRLPFVESPPEHLGILRAGLSASAIT